MNTFKYFLAAALILTSCQFSIGQSKQFHSTEYLLDSTITTNAIYGFGVVTQRKEVFYYNNNNNISLNEVFLNTNIYLDSVIWEKFFKTNYSYLNPDELSEVIRERKTDDGWKFDTKNEYTYNTNEKIFTFYNWEIDQWIPSGKFTTFWIPSKNQKQDLKQYWNIDLSEWENYSMKDTILTASGMYDTIKNFQWLASNIMDTISVEAYDYTYYPDTIIVTKERYDDIVYITKQFHDNSIKADIELTYKKASDTNVFLPNNKKVYYFDDNNNMVRYRIYFWMNDSWSVQGQQDYIYNPQNLLVDFLVYYYSDTTNPYRRVTYAYNEENLLAEEKYYDEPANLDSYTMYEHYYSPINTAIDEFDKDLKTIVFPNPASDFIYFYNADIIFESYSILNQSGQQILRGKSAKNRQLIDISNLSAGIYYLILYSRNASFSKAFIKNK